MAILSLMKTMIDSPYILASSIILGIVYCIQWYLGRPKRPQLPIADKAKDGNLTEALMKMKTMHPNEPFILPMSSPRLVLPHTMGNEIDNMPSNKISFRKAIYKIMQGQYTGIGVPSSQLIDAIKIDLTRNVSKTLTALQDEVAYAVGEEIGACHDWTPIKPYTASLQIVAKASARVFVGLPLCRDEAWIKTTIHYTEDLMKGLRAVEPYPLIVRPFIAPFIPDLRKVRQYRKQTGKMLASTVLEVINAAKRWGANGKGATHTKDDTAALIPDEQFNLIAWILSRYKNNEKVDAERVGQEQLLTSFAAIHTTSTTMTQVIFDLASHPEYASLLRAEIVEVSAEEPDGELRKTSLPKLRKLDSFIKESQRMHPLNMLPIARVVTAKEGVTLSNGLHLSYDTIISMAHTQQTSAIPTEFMAKTPPQPSFDEFHPFRYSDLRSYPGEENKHQLVSVSPESLTFGHGQWACPGRFFASNEIKSIVIELIKNYDIGLGPKGEGEGDQFKRPMTYTSGASYIPDPNAVIYFKRRQAS